MNFILKKHMFFLCYLFFLVSFILIGCTTDSSKDCNVDADLWYAINCGNLEAVKEVVEAGANINQFYNRSFYERNNHNNIVSTPLFVAIVNGKHRIAEYLIDCGANVNCYDDESKSLLQYCAEFKPEFVEKIILSGADIYYVDDDGYTALDSAIKCEIGAVPQKSFDILINYGVVPTLKNLETLLSDLDVTKYGFLKKIFETTNYAEKDIPFLQNKYFAILQDKHSEINESHTNISLNYIAAFKEWDLLKEHVNPENVNHFLKVATIYNNIEIVSNILNMYSDFNTYENHDYLYYAALNDNVELVDKIYKNMGGNVPLATFNAIYKHNNNVVKYFIDCGIDLKNKTLEADLLSICCLYENYDAFKMFFNNGATANEAAFKYACEYGYVDFVKLFLEYGANADCKVYYDDGSGGKSALHSAIDTGQMEIVVLLVNNGADIFYEYLDKNAIEYAANEPSDNIYNYLRRQGDCSHSLTYIKCQLFSHPSEAEIMKGEGQHETDKKEFFNASSSCLLFSG